MGKNNIILYGEKNVGKTTTLKKLVELLAGGSTAVSTALSGIADGRFVIDYVLNGVSHLILISTAGDTWDICRKSGSFFELDFSHGLVVYQVSSTGIVKIKGLNKVPEICICACSIDERDMGPIKALHQYSEAHLMDYDAQLWIRMKEVDDDDKSSVMANNLKSLVDAILNGRMPF